MRGKCIACQKIQEVDRAHIRTRGAGAGWEDHEFVLLCRAHHISQGAWGWYKFTQRYPQVMAELNRKGWEIREEFGIKRVKRKQ